MAETERQAQGIALSEESIHLLLQDFGRYQEPIPQAILKYLVEGGDDGVLQQLQERFMVWPSERSLEFRYWCPYPSYATRCQFLQSLTTQDLEFYVRLTQIYTLEVENLKWHTPLTLGWLGLFLLFLGNHEGVVLSLDQPLTLPPTITAELIESLLVQVGDPADSLARVVFLTPSLPSSSYLEARSPWIGACLPGFSSYALKYPAVVQEALTHSVLEVRVHALNMLDLGQISPVPFAALLVDRATAQSKMERAAAFSILQRDARAVVPFVQAKAETGKATERAYAARLLLDLIGVDAKVFLEERLEREKTASVQDAIVQVLTDLAVLSTPEAEISLSPLPTVALEAPLSPAVRADIEKALHRLCEFAQATYTQLNYQQYPDIPWPELPSPELVDRVFHGLQFGTADDCLALVPVYHLLAHLNAPAQFRQLLEIPELEIIHVARLLMLLKLMHTQINEIFPTAKIPNGMQWKEPEINSDLQRWCQQRQPNSSLRYLASGLEALGISGDILAWKMLSLEESPFWGWGESAIAEYFGDRLSILDTLFELGPFPQVYFTHEQTARRQLFRILEAFPQLPHRFIPLLWDIALTGLQAEMPLAQRCLDDHPGTQERLHQLANHHDPALQMIAIQWLTRLKDQTAIPIFQTLLRNQPAEAVRDLLLRSLEKLGTSIDEFLDPSQLLQESQTGLQKGIPKGLSWFPFTAFPTVRWQETGEVVEPEILTWFVVQSYQQKNPEPSPVLRQYVKLWHPDDRQQYGQFVLESWIQQDSQVASAVKEKGILAVAGACGSAAMVPVINHYLKTYFGKRLPQCLALLQMLAWSDDFAAIQLLLTLANRFRTQKIQEAAKDCVQQLAERQGWTLEELSDRTIPWCGLEADGTLLLNYGSRTFTASLDGDCKLILSNESGKILKSLPTANQGDDPQQVKTAKQQWTATKKQVELVRSQQQARLYEALCTQRSWTFADWEMFLHQHPIVSRLCQRLIWAVYDNNFSEIIQTFRPQTDGNLVNPEGHSVTVSPTAIIRLAQATLLSETLTQAWQKHLQNLQITPLFPNWISVYPLSSQSQETTEIKEFVGHSLSRHQLRQRAMQQGYIPKTEEFEHGWSFEYRKKFASLNLEAVIDFSGDTPASTEEFDVQLGEVYFQQGRRLSLAEVSPVLLSMVWSEIAAMLL